MNQDFSFKRYTQLLRHDLAENKQTYRFFTLASVIGSGIVMTLCIGLSILRYQSALHSGDEWTRERALNHITIGYGIDIMLLTAIAVIMSGVAQSTLCSCYNSRMKRIRYLMIPGTACEKFAARFVITSVWGALLPIVVGLTAASVHTLVLASYDPEVVRVFTRDLAALLSDLTLHQWLLGIVSVITFILANTTLYMLASAVFRSYAYIKLQAIQYALSIPLTIFMPMLAAEWFDVYFDFMAKYPYTFGWLFNGLGLVLSMAMAWGSYVLFKRTEITGYKLRKS